MPFQEFQAPRVVPGYGAEEQVGAEGEEVARLIASVHPVGAAMGVDCRLVAAGAQVGLDEGAQDALRLFDTGEFPGEYRFGDGDRLRVGSPPRQMEGHSRGDAARTVGAFVLGGGAPPFELGVRGRHVADVAGHLAAQAVDGVQAVAAFPVAALHIVEQRIGAVERDLRKIGQCGDDPLELPQQPVVRFGAVAGGVRVEGGEAAGEGCHRPRRLAPVLVRLGEGHPQVEHVFFGGAAADGQIQGFLQAGGAGPAVGQG